MKKRETELDILRILALVAVIWVHVGGMESKVLPTSDPHCQWLIFLKSIMTWEIPVYVMISGRFFLDPGREVSFSRIRKAILRLVAAFVFWNVLYQLWYIPNGSYDGLNWKGFLSQALIGPYHFWYLYMIAGLYLITPFLRKIAEDKRLSEYFIGLFFLFSFLTKYAVELPFLGATLGSMLDSMGMKFVLGYSGYYVLGYYLHRYPLSDKWECCLYIFGVVLLLSGAAANTLQSVYDGAYTEQYTGYTNPNTVIVASAMFTLFVKRVSKVQLSGKMQGWITKLSEYSFGVYLIHALVLDFISAIGLKPSVLHPIVMMPVITLLTFTVTTVLVALIRKIPAVGKKIT